MHIYHVDMDACLLAMYSSSDISINMLPKKGKLHCGKLLTIYVTNVRGARVSTHLNIYLQISINQ